MIKRGRAFELRCEIKDPNFVRPPTDSQRNWVLQRALDECAADLKALDDATRRFVRGGQRPIIDQPWSGASAAFDQTTLTIQGQQVMQSWEQPLMAAMAALASASGGDVLEVGFGMGISASAIQQHGVRSHTVIECNSEVARQFARWREQFPERDIRLVQGTWQDTATTLGPFDAILFDSYPISEQELVLTLTEHVTFAEPFIPVAARLLRSGGIFTYYTNEIDSLSRRHQRLLLEHFREFTVTVVHSLQPPDDCQYWWADSMAIVKAVV